MKAVIIVESMFGNTRSVAETIAQTLRARMEVDVYDVASAPTYVPSDASLLLVGGPTHAFGMSRASTRADAAKRGASVNPGPGLREWLASQHPLPSRVNAAAFDTHIDKHFPGAASHAASRRLRRLGAHVVTAPTSFYVTDTAGPLAEGELERAQKWADGILNELEKNGLLAAS